MNEPKTRSGVKSAYRKSRKIVETRQIDSADGPVDVHSYEPFRVFLRRVGWTAQLKRSR